MLSKYFSSANENKNKENTEINKDGIKVNKEKNIMYFLFATEPLTLILFFKEFFVSRNIIIKNASNKKILANSRNFRF